MNQALELDVLQDVTGRLDRAGIAYMLSGSLAMSFYAVPRMTRDIDLVVALHEEDRESILRLFGNDYYVSADDVARALRDASMFNLLHLANVVKVDIMIAKDTQYRVVEFDRRRRARLAGIDVWIVAKEDLVLSKLAWAKPTSSELQLRDVRTLLATGCDAEYMREWAPALGVEDLLEACLRAGHDT
jgi:hypothetical protein